MVRKRPAPKRRELVTISAMVRKESIAILDDYAVENDTTRSWHIRQALRQYIEMHERRKKLAEAEVSETS